MAPLSSRSHHFLTVCKGGTVRVANIGETPAHMSRRSLSDGTSENLQQLTYLRVVEPPTAVHGLIWLLSAAQHDLQPPPPTIDAEPTVHLYYGSAVGT
jgi:hypothetical protein